MKMRTFFALLMAVGLALGGAACKKKGAKKGDAGAAKKAPVAAPAKTPTTKPAH